jgi:hypothetical protein
MQLTSILFATLATLGFASANSIIFLSRDKTDRFVCFYAAPGHATPVTQRVPDKSTVAIPIPQDWEGAWQTSFSATNCGPVGIRGEVKFNGFEDKTFYDVSAIDAQNDNSGVKFLYAQSGQGVKSGCEHFPCSRSYNKWDDVQTQVTEETDLIIEIGG